MPDDFNLEDILENAKQIKQKNDCGDNPPIQEEASSEEEQLQNFAENLQKDLLGNIPTAPSADENLLQDASMTELAVKKKKHSMVIYISVFAALLLLAAVLWGLFRPAKNTPVSGQDVSSPSSSSSAPLTEADLLQPYILQNPDTVGRLSLQGVFTLPVVQGEDNAFYASHSFDKNENENGTPYLDARCSLSQQLRHHIIYAPGVAELEQYKNIDYYRSHPLLQWVTLQGGATYKIAGVSILGAEQDDSFDWDVLFENASPQLWEEYNAGLYQHSLFHTQTTLEEGDILLTLVVDFPSLEGGKLLITARQLRSGETLEVNTSAAVENPSPILPQQLQDGSEQSSAPDSSSNSDKSSASSGNNGGQGSSAPKPPINTKPQEEVPDTPDPAPPVDDNPVTPPTPPDDTSKPDDSTPSGEDYVQITTGGQVITRRATEAVARYVATEINAAYPLEAIKAQSIAAYTYIKYQNQSGIAPAIAQKASPEQIFYTVAEQTKGIAMLTSSGTFPYTPWFAMSIGVTQNSQDVWVQKLPHLQSVSSSIEIGKNESSVSPFEKTVSYSVEEVRSAVENATGLTLSSNPANWFVIQSYNQKVNYNGRQIGYVGQILIDGQKIVTGRYVRETIFKSFNGSSAKRFRSPAFDNPVYNSSAGTISFTTYGYGHGCGMSQFGAKLYAAQGWSYQQILSHYYPGLRIEQVQ